MKIAILILAHKSATQLNRLIGHLSSDFDLFVHLDRKSLLRIEDIEAGENIRVFRQYPVYHGSPNMNKACLELLRAAFSKGYDRYLLISGQDVPIKTNKEIHDFFTNNPNEYLECERLPKKDWDNGGLERVRKYHPLSPYGTSGIKKYFLLLQKKLWKAFNILLHVERNLDTIFYGGSNWFNVSHACVSGILQYLEQNPGYINRYRFTSNSDEIFLQTIIMNLPLNNEIVQSSLRYVDWASGPEFPRILRVTDYDKIVNSGMLFARKVDDNVDAEISNMLYKNCSK